MRPQKAISQQTVDEDTRTEMIELIRKVMKENSIAALHVTHSQSEADLLADCIFRLIDGKIEEGIAT